VQLMDVDIHGVGLEHRAAHLLRTQHRHHSPRLGGVEPLNPGVERRQFIPGFVEFRFLPRHGEHQRAARREDRVFGKAVGPRFIESAARAGQRADRAIAVSLGEQRGGAAGAVITGLALAFEQHDPPAGRQMRRRRRAGHPGADDEQVAGFGQVAISRDGRRSSLRSSARLPWARPSGRSARR
jgi:hypothetical protein